MTHTWRAVVVGALLPAAVFLSSCSGGSSNKATPKTSNGAANASSTSASGTVSSTGAGGTGVNPNASEAVVPGDIPDTQVYVPYGGAGYQIKVPQGWARADTQTGAVFTDHFNTERLDRGTAAAAPTVGSVRSVTVPQLQSTNAGFALKDVTTVTRPAGTVVLTTYRANSATDPVTNKYVVLDVERYDFWKNGMLVTVTLSGPKGSDNVDPWKTITDSFTWQ